MEIKVNIGNVENVDLVAELHVSGQRIKEIINTTQPEDGNELLRQLGTECFRFIELYKLQKNES